ncbi:MAG: DNA primase [Clostridia bacterium]|nr:DNA primase [Clostridia bacterium]
MAHTGGFISDDIRDEILNKADIESVVGSYVTFTKRTGQNLLGLCPFHSEKTPSFTVSLNKNIFHCFGCQKGGNAITFIQEMEHLSYPEAIRFLGKQYGVDVPERTREGNSNELSEKKDRVRSILNEAAKYYYMCLIDPKIGKVAREYAINRNLSPSTCKKFGLGYAPNGFSNLYGILHDKGYKDDELLNSGLFVRSSKNGKVYDLFHDRLMFPIFDSFGKLIAFGGRTLIDDKAKYVNSPDSLVYNKKEHFYGLNFAKKERSSRLIIVEGYMDTIAMHQAGVTNAVASLGTAFTEEQLRLASKYASEIVFFFDADNAGQKAAIRAIQMIQAYMRKIKTLEVRVKIAKVPNAKDPDEFIREFGKERFQEVVDNALDVDKYLTNKAYEDNFKDGSLDDFSYQKDIIRYGSWLSDPVKQGRMASVASPYLNASPDVIVDRMKDASIKINQEELRQARVAEQRKARVNDYPVQEYDPDDIPPETNEEEIPVEQEHTNSLAGFSNPNRVPSDLAYREEIDLMVLAVLLGKDLANEEFINNNWILTPEDFVGDNMKDFVKYILDNFDDEEGIDIDMFQAYLMQFTLNGISAREAFLEAFRRISRYCNEFKVKHDMYLKALFLRRISILKNAYFNDSILYSNTSPDLRASIEERMKIVQNNIDVYQREIERLDEIK